MAEKSLDSLVESCKPSIGKDSKFIVPTLAYPGETYSHVSILIGIASLAAYISSRYRRTQRYK